MTVSVIIATYNRAALLDECLAHLTRAAFEEGDEILVVDNGSDDGTPAIVARHARTSPVSLRLLHEAQPGKSHALRHALAAARGDILAFTDDDVNVPPEWIASIRAAMIGGDTSLLGGPVAPRWERPAPRWLRLAPGYGRLASPLALLDYGPDPCDLGPRTVIGANLAVRRDDLERLGGFAPHLGKLRGTLLSGEDHDLCRRVQAAGLKAVYWPTPAVRHWVPADRLTLRYFLSWFYWSGITHAALEEGEPRRGRQLLGVPRYLVGRFISGIFGALLALVSGRLPRAFDYAIDVAFAAGYASHRWGLVALAPPAARQAVPA